MEDTVNNAIRYQAAVPAALESQVQVVSAPNRLSQAETIPERLAGRLSAARERLRQSAENGVRIRVYEVALDLDMSEFHFARQFRAAYGCSPHVFYDEVRAARARDLLSCGQSEGTVARSIGLRRPAELRALLAKRQKVVSLQGIAAADIDW
jgi:AraC-like DNA-binding protein